MQSRKNIFKIKTISKFYFSKLQVQKVAKPEINQIKQRKRDKFLYTSYRNSNSSQKTPQNINELGKTNLLMKKTLKSSDLHIEKEYDLMKEAVGISLTFLSGLKQCSVGNILRHGNSDLQLGNKTKENESYRKKHFWINKTGGLDIESCRGL